MKREGRGGCVTHSEKPAVIGGCASAEPTQIDDSRTFDLRHVLDSTILAVSACEDSESNRPVADV